MFIRTIPYQKKSTDSSGQIIQAKKVQIVENKREGSKVIQKIIRHLGVAHNDEEVCKLKELGQWIISEQICKKSLPLYTVEELTKVRIKSQKEKEEKLLVNLRNLREEKKVNIGIEQVYGKLFDELGFIQSFENPSRKRSQIKVLKDIVLARLSNPVSKRKSQEILETEHGKKYSLDKIYRMLEKLDDQTIERIKNISSENTKKLFKEKLDVMFFDVTTLYFESFTEDELKKNGYSKDLKFNQPQVLLSLLITKQGMPVDYEVYPGNEYEGNLLIPSLNKLKEKHSIDKVILVADSGILNQANIEALNQMGIEYIMGARVKSSTQEIKEKILNRDLYKVENDNLSIQEIKLEETPNKRLIVTHKKTREKKDKIEREKAIDKLKVKLEKNKNIKNFISNYGYKKYLTSISDTKVEINQEKLKEEEKWDGIIGIVTNTKLSNQEVVEQYGKLWEVEAAFRVTKHDLKIRPIYHWKEQKIKAHICICFIAYTLFRHLNYRLELISKSDTMSFDEISTHLNRTELTIVKDVSTSMRYAIPSKLSSVGGKIYRSINLKYNFIPFKIS